MLVNFANSVAKPRGDFFAALSFHSDPIKGLHVPYNMYEKDHHNRSFGKLKGKLLIISVGVKVPIGKSNGKVKQIVLEGGEK